MAQTRYDISREQLTRAVARLHDALAEDETEIVRDAVIQRFEFCYELSWKTLRHRLREQAVDVPEFAPEVLKQAFKAGLITDAARWDRIRLYRNQTSHTYDEAKAIEVAAFVRGQAVDDFDRLLATLGQP